MTWRYHLALRVLRREDRSRREPLFLPSGSQGLRPELRVCTARTAFPEGQVTRPQAELRGQPRSPPPRGRAPKGPSSESPLPEAEANRPQEAAPSRPRPPGLCQEPLSGPERPLPTAQPFPGLDRCLSRPLGQALTKYLYPGAQQTLDPARRSHWWTDPFFLCRYILKGPTYPPSRFPQEHVIFLALSHPYRLTAIAELRCEAVCCLFWKRRGGTGLKNHTMDGHSQDYPSMR